MNCRKKRDSEKGKNADIRKAKSKLDRNTELDPEDLIAGERK
jgi:hypothetical protein